MDIKNWDIQKQDKFGQRYLRDESVVFEYNAWDDVEWPKEKEKEIQEKLRHQRTYPTQEDIASELLKKPEQQWDIFYQAHKNKFFMDRKWLNHEFPELFESVS